MGGAIEGRQTANPDGPSVPCACPEAVCNVTKGMPGQLGAVAGLPEQGDNEAPLARLNENRL